MSLISNLVRMVRIWHRYNQSLRELNELGDRELADIGILRADLQTIAWKAAHAD